MAGHVLREVKGLKGMTTLNRAAFTVNVPVPYVSLGSKQLNRFMAQLKAVILKGIRNFKSVQHVDNVSAHVYCDPILLNEGAKLDLQQKAANLEVEIGFGQSMVSFDYESFPVKAILDTVLPDESPFGAFSEIGHIIHLNLREEHAPYKHLIGQVLLDKTRHCRTVVNKTDLIQTKFRNFSMELLAGEPDYVASVKENGMTFTLNFEKVFWNPRLGTEHARLLKSAISSSPNCAVYDVFAGIGPFALPAARQHGALVFANDLNPDSVEYLRKNAELNRCQIHRTTCLDGAEFIKTVVGPAVHECLYPSTSASQPVVPPTNPFSLEPTPEASIANPLHSISHHHAIMNLPAIADTFLPSYIGCVPKFKPTENANDSEQNGAGLNGNFTFTVHVYLFTKNAINAKEAAEQRVRWQLRPHSVKIIDIHHVRTVASEKEMMCVSVQLPISLLTADAIVAKSATDVDESAVSAPSEPDEKRARIE